MTTRDLLFAVVLAPLLAAGCGGGSATSEPVCEPACPAGFSCTRDGCVSPGAPRDLGAPLPDAGGGCDPGCRAPTPVCVDGACVACATSGDCGGGSVCVKVGGAAFCAPGCTDDKGCAGDAGGVAGRCCGALCIDSDSDPANCGACGAACSAQNASPVCAAGQCGLGACHAGYDDCNHRPDDGCETSLRADPANCGACGTACAARNAITGCAGGCFIASCSYGFDDCNGVPDDGCEAGVMADIHNCGGCGMSCPIVSRGKPTCGGGFCGATCDPGYGDCDGQLNNGCEASFTTDSANCGACGKACGQGLVCINGACTCPRCVFANARSACVNLVCTLAECLPGFADCNGSTKDGCEANLDLDGKNCGACNNACPMDTPSCLNGKCVLFQGLQQITDPGMDKRVVLQNGGGALSMNLDALDGSANVIMTQSAAVQVGGGNAVGIPDTGFFPANNDHPDVQLAANNDNDGSFNARILVKTGSFNLPVPQRTYKQLQLYAISTEGVSNLTITLNYADNSTDTVKVSVLDWYTHPPSPGQFYLIDKMDRYSIAKNSYDAAHTPGMVGFDTKPDPNKQLLSLDVQLTSGGWFVFFGATGQ